MRTIVAVFAGLIAINITWKLMDYAGVWHGRTPAASGHAGYYTVTHRCAPDFERLGLSQGSRFYIEQILLMDLQINRDFSKHPELQNDAAIENELKAVGKDVLPKYVKFIPDPEKNLVADTLRSLKSRSDIMDCLSKAAGST